MTDKLLIAFLLSLCGSPLLHAQSSPETVIEEILVTAQKREQSVQDIPVAVSAISKEALEQSGAQTIEDVQSLAPSLTVTSVNIPGSSTQIQIRGVGTSTTNVGLEAAVGFFLDGVYRSRSGMAVGDLLDVSRVEVLRGPQSSIFGKNTSAGAISVVTEKPTYEVSGAFQVDGGDYDARRLQAVYNTPLVQDTLALRLSGSVNRRDGYVDDVVNGRDYNDTDRWSMRGQLLWEPADNLSMRLIADWSEADETSVVPVRAVNGPLDATVFQLLAGDNGGVINVPADISRRETSLNDPTDTTVEDRGVSLEVNYAAPFGEVTSITALRSYDAVSFKDVDFSALDFFVADFDFRQDFFSTELRANNVVNDAGPFASVDWLVGAFYSEEEISSRARFPTQGQLPLQLSALANGLDIPLTPADFASGADTGPDVRRGIDGTTFALFGQATFDLSDRYGFTVGLRYSDEEKENFTIDQTVAGPGNVLLGLFAPAPDFGSLDFDEDKITGDASFHVHWSEQLMTYIKYATGYKAGGVNVDGGGAGTFAAPRDPSFDSETSESFELGLRSEWAGGKAIVNATAFHTAFDDFQVQSFDGINFLLRNVSGVTSEGVEVEATLRPLPAWTISGGVTYADARFDSGVNTGFAPVGGERLPLSSEWTGSIASTYEAPLTPNLTGWLHLEAYSRSSSNLDSGTLDPVALQPGYTLYNARIGLAPVDDRWRLSLWCRNCTDKSYAVFTFAAGFQPGSFVSVIGPPRTWGLTLGMNF